MNEINGINILFQGFNVLNSSYPSIMDSATTGVGLVVPKDSENVHTEEYLGTEYTFPVGVSFTSNPSPISFSTAISGNSESNYSSELAASINIKGSYGLFSGSLNSSYGNEVSVGNSNYYSSCIQTGTAYTLGFNSSDVDIYNGEDGSANFVVSEQLKEDFEMLEPDNDGANAITFFDRWGTHLISGINCGGQTSYSMYGSASNFKSMEEFELKAKGKYQEVSGSTSFELKKKVNTKNVEANSSLTIIGGSVDANSQLMESDPPTNEDYANWYKTIQENATMIGFVEGGLSLVSDLCHISETKTYLENVYNQLTGLCFVTPSEGASQTSTMSYEDSPGAEEGEDYYVEVKDKEGNRKTFTWNMETDEVLVGVGININTEGSRKGRIKRMVVVTLNLKTYEYNNYFFGNGNKNRKWQSFCLAPQNAIITGFGLAVKDEKLSNLVVYHQEVLLKSQDGVYLSPEVNILQSSKEGSHKIDFSNLQFGQSFASNGGTISSIDPIIGFNRSATVDFPVKDGNDQIIRGFSIHATNNSKGDSHRGFDYLTANFSVLKLDTN
ncbi:MAG: hypothetical protein JKY02_02450 [Flavobacteriaceae bacterium]|nr:hypothetical protein [Flavobacteriaceae bacterium]